jgi:AraC family transcriptional regulator
MDTLQRLQRVTDYIHDHLADELDLATLAQVACMSPYHWHRTYHAVFGETIAHTERRIRLHRAGGYLANSSASVGDIARRCGYPNVQSFSRAFRVSHDISPLQFRKQGGHTLFTHEAGASNTPEFEVIVREVPLVRLAGLEHRGPYMLIGKAFEASRAQFVSQQLMRNDTRWLAVFFDDPASLEEKHLRARRFVVARRGFTRTTTAAVRVGGWAVRRIALPRPLRVDACRLPLAIRPLAVELGVCRRQPAGV